VFFRTEERFIKNTKYKRTVKELGQTKKKKKRRRYQNKYKQQNNKNKVKEKTMEIRNK
jgi:hypothetical protein